MKLIPIRKKVLTVEGKFIGWEVSDFVKVDDEDYDFLMQWKWSISGRGTGYKYASRNHYFGARQKKTILLHRIIFPDLDDNVLIDHKDRDTLNCQKSNLRKVTRSQNNSNKRAKVGGASKYLGVSVEKRRGRINFSDFRYQVMIRKDGKAYHLGAFPYTPCGEICAALAYDKKAIELHGEFANLNFK